MKKLSILVSFSFLLIALSGNLFAQEQLKHEKRFYVDSEGKLYVNKEKPIYFFISDSPDANGKKHLLQGEEASKKYTNPMYLDTEGWNTLRSPSAVDTVTKETIKPLRDVKFEVHADSKAPKTSISVSSAPNYFKSGILYVGKGLSVSLKANDATSGVEKTYLSSNGASFSEYTKPIEFNTENEYIFKYYSADNVGNAEETKEKKINLDLTAPLTKFRIEGDKFQDILSKRSIIYFDASDAKSGVKKIYYAIDDNEPRAITSYLKLTSLSEGNHVLKYYAIDNVNNKEEIKSYNFFLDRSAPIIIDEVQGNSFMLNGKSYSSGRTKIKLTAVDNKAGVKSIHYSINGKKYEVYNKPFYLPTKTGSTSIKYYATDNVNNKVSTNNDNKKSTATYVDLSGPNLSHSFSSPKFTTRDTIFISTKTKITLRATDAEAGVNKITYNANKKGELNFTEPFSIKEEGFHSINYTGYDNVENTNSENFFFILDNTAPILYPRFSITPIGKKSYDGKSVEVFSPHVSLFLSATDTQVGVSKIYYSINEGSQRVYASAISGFSKGKEYSIKVRIIDYLGNEKIESINFATGN